MLVAPLTRPIWVMVASAMAAFVLGGVAWAAETGSLPDPAQRVAHDLFSAMGVPPPRPQDTVAGREDVDEGELTDDEPGRTAKPGHEPDGDDDALAQLCRARRAEREHRDGEPLDAESRSRLSAAAGGEANVDRYCGKILADEEVGTSPETNQPHPSPSAVPVVTDGDDPSHTNPDPGPPS